jgi:hypothetical protein
MLAELESRVARGELSLRGVNDNVVELDAELLLNVNAPEDLVAAASLALDEASVERPVLPPDEDALAELVRDFWTTTLWAARRLRKGDVFLAIDSVNGTLKRTLVTLLSWHALAVDPRAPVLDAGRGLERWADAGALSSLERAYADYDVRDVARALWDTVDLFQLVEDETAQRLGYEVGIDQAELRRRLAQVVRDPRPGATL